MRVAFAFLAVGISLKLALFPLHLWLPNAYAYAPSAVTAFIASTATKVAFYVLLRFLFTIFGVGFAFSNMLLGGIFLVLGLLAIFAGSISKRRGAMRPLRMWSQYAKSCLLVGCCIARPTQSSIGCSRALSPRAQPGP